MSMVRTEGQTIRPPARYLLLTAPSLVLPIFVENNTTGDTRRQCGLCLPYSIDNVHETLSNCAGLLIYTAVVQSHRSCTPVAVCRKYRRNDGHQP